MGNSLHNKIYLGRRASVLQSKPMRALLCMAALSVALLALLIFHTVP